MTHRLRIATIFALGLAWCLFAETAFAQKTHVVKSGDSLDRIARQYGVRVPALIAENDLDRPDFLKPGQVLKIPTAAAPVRKRYTVVEGDSLGTIARDHNVSPASLAALNKLSDPDKLRVGQILEIPSDGTPPAPPQIPLPTSLKNTLDTIPVRNGRWKYIVIHHSATANGSAQGMENYHRFKRHMENGLAYHFVIGNGKGMPDGQIAIGRRWRSQLNGGHLASERLNEVAIGICLVGNFNQTRPTPAQMRSLTALTSYLLQRTRLSATAVRAHRQINTKPTECPGHNFPMKTLLQGLP
ncbi:MAG: LysM peptidoglycan-binding domain-containing protein [Kiritimatiellae bacterium]|nr:LysM peptidoglycan-binding domain-containing protein [Kiritimatiellia bacterium]